MAFPTHYNTDAVESCRQALYQHAGELKNQKITEFFTQDSQRLERMSQEAAGLHLDVSKSYATSETLEKLVSLAEAAGLPDMIQALFDGEVINHTEQRSVLHTALRSPETEKWVDGCNIMPEISNTLARMQAFVDRIHSGQWLGYDGRPIQDVVSIGIGGSYLGPRVVNEALRSHWMPGLRCHFVSNIDATDICSTLKDLSPATTLFIIQSKSFKTQETLTNAESAKAWFLAGGGTQAAIDRHFVAVSSNVELAREFGIDAEHIFPMWDWVGGRYSLWSAIGLPIALQVGMKAFRELLGGANDLDEHFRKSPLSQNLPVTLGLLGIWYQNFLGANSCAIIPYDQGLENLAAHLQQVDMESNGKQVERDGQPARFETGAVIWGGAGTNGQHAYHQLLHQGTSWIPVDFILPLKSQYDLGRHHAMLVSNCLAQSQALLFGKTLEQARDELQHAEMSETEIEQLAIHKVIPGNRPSHLITMEQLTPQTLGALIALYEHKVMVQGVIWNLNSYDQWGVELGKQLCNSILPLLESNDGDLSHLDPSTAAAIGRYRQSKT